MSENNSDWFAGMFLAIIFGSFLLMGLAMTGPDIPDIPDTRMNLITYEFPVPETNCTHVKLSVIHDSPGARDQEYNFKIREIPENKVIIYKIDYSIKHVFVFMDFYNESGSGYENIHSEKYLLEHLRGST